MIGADFNGHEGNRDDEEGGGRRDMQKVDFKKREEHEEVWRKVHTGGRSI